MIEESIRELIDRDIEGETTAEERSRLVALLEEQPEVRGYYDRMALVARALDAPRLVEPPAGLRESILRGIGAWRAGREREAGFLTRIAGLFAVPRVRYVVVGAAGIAIGFFGAGLALDGRVGSPEFRDRSAGTLVTGRPGPGAVPASKSFRTPEAAGAVRLVRGADGHVVEIAIEAATESRVEITFDPAATVVRGILFDAAGTPSIRSELGRIELVHEGNVTYRIACGEVASASARLAWRIRTAGGDTEGVLEMPVFEP